MSKTLIVTGGSRGIGAAICRLAGAAGYAVAVNYRSDEAAAASVVADIEAAGGRAIAIQADIAVEADIAALFAQTEQAFGPVTHLVNNAGITGPAGRLEDMSTQTLRAVTDLNVVGTILCARTAVQLMSTRRGGAGGVIVNISSSAVTTGTPDIWVWYAASKAAIETFTIGLGREVAADGIRVAAVAPGFTATDILTNLGDGIDKIAALIPLGRPATPEEIAKSVLFLLSEDASYVTASVLRVAGGR
jgi:NAD(P)-dependent dehydrogenase (short-subunit alcohol dehydrogenase family)